MGLALLASSILEAEQSDHRHTASRSTRKNGISSSRNRCNISELPLSKSKGALTRTKFRVSGSSHRRKVVVTLVGPQIPPKGETSPQLSCVIA